MSEETADDLLDALMLVEGSDEAGSPMTAAECVEALAESFPGFWWRGGTCALSSEVVIAPDYNDPEHGERLLTEYPPELEHWNSGVEVELRPGSDAAFCRAFLAAMIRIKLAKLGLFPGEVETTEICGCGACSETTTHASDCAVHNAPALPAGPCDCGSSGSQLADATPKPTHTEESKEL